MITIEDRQLSMWRTGVVAAGVIAVIVTLIDRLDILPIFGDGDGGRLDPSSLSRKG